MQGSEEWFNDRLGYVTGSCFSSVLAKGEGKVRSAYLRRVVSERLTGKTQNQGFSTPDTERGNEQEPYARMEYEAETGNIVEEVGFIKHETLRAGCSPDGVIDLNGGLEIKSVIPTVQLETVERGKYPPKHKPQIQGGLWVTGREYWDYVSFSPDLPKNLRLYVYRVERDEEYIKSLEEEVIRFLDEAEVLYQSLLNRIN